MSVRFRPPALKSSLKFEERSLKDFSGTVYCNLTFWSINLQVFGEIELIRYTCNMSDTVLESSKGLGQHQFKFLHATWRVLIPNMANVTYVKWNVGILSY